MQKFADVVLDRKGNVVPGATVRVKTSGGSDATLYADALGAPANNPAITDDFGRFSFYAVNGRYNLQVFIGNTLLSTSQDILLEDPLDKTAEAIKGGTIEDVALTNVTIDGKQPGFKQDTDALAVRATALESGAAAMGVRATALEAETDSLDQRVDTIESQVGTIPAGLGQRVTTLESGATTQAARTTELETDTAQLDVRVTSLQGTALTDAPNNEKTYARKARTWVELPPATEYWDASIYLPTLTYGPNNRIVELYPRLNLSRPVLSACFVRRATTSPENLTLVIKPTSGTDWTATAIIPAGQLEGFFSSGTVLPIDATQGIYIAPSPLPAQAVTGLSLTLRFEIEKEQTVSMLMVPQPLPQDTLVVFGETPPNSPSFILRNLGTGSVMAAADAGANTSYLDCSVSANNVYFLYCKANGNLIVAELQTGATRYSKVDGIVRKGASGNKDSNKVLTAEYRDGKWYAVIYNLPTFTKFQEIDLSVYGVTSLNSIRYSPNDRWVMVGHSGGSFVLNVLTMTPLVLKTPPVGSVLEVDMTPAIYAVISRKLTDFQLNITTNGNLMTRTGTTVWEETTCSAFNWFTETPTQYPYFVVAGRTSVGWQVVPYAAGDFAYQEMPWRINFGERIVSVAFSETTLISEQATETIFGRALVVCGEHGYKVYDLQTGAEVAAQTLNNFTKITGGLWKWVPGVVE